MTDGPRRSGVDATGTARGEALPSGEYDRQWRVLSDYIRYHPGARHRRRIILELVQGLRFGSILDAGCGPGELIDLFQRELPGHELWGADFAPEVIEANRRRFPEAHFEVVDLQAGPLDRRFDLVVCSEVIEHLPDPAAAFAHLAAMVEPGGHLLVTCPTGKIHATEVHFGHLRHLDEPELLALGRENGLRVVRSRNWGFPLYAALKYATNVNAQWAIDNFAERDYSLAAKALSNALYWVNFLNVDSRRGVSLFALFEQPQ